MKPVVLALCLAALAGCVTASAPVDPTAPPVRDDLVGRWAMELITDQGADVSAEQNPAGDRYIVLRPDGTFESGGQPYGRNTGQWRYHAPSRTLGLDSDAGPDNDSLWIVTLRDGRMEWGGTGSAFARRFRIVARRAG